MSVVDVWNPYRYGDTNLPIFWFDALDASVTASGYDSTPGLTGSSDDGYVVQRPHGLGGPRDFGQGHRINVASYPAATKILMAAQDPDGGFMACLAMNTDGTLSVWNGNLTAQIADDTDTPLPTSTWTRLGFRAYLDGSIGWVEIHVDGEVVRRASDVNTDPDGRGGWARYYVGLTTDIIVGHGYAIDGGDLLPAAYVVDAAPIGAGPSIYDGEWVPTGAATVYEAIDDTDHDGDTTRIQADGPVGKRYATEHSLDPTTRIVYAVKHTSVVRNVTGAGISYSHRLLVNVDGSEDISTWQSATQDEWRAIERVLVTNPITGLPWTPATINAPTYWGGQLEG